MDCLSISLNLPLSISVSQFLHAPLGYRCRLRWGLSLERNGNGWPYEFCLLCIASIFFFSSPFSVPLVCFQLQAFFSFSFNPFFLHRLSNSVKVVKQVTFGKMAREYLKRSDEEEDTLRRSTKKFKENHISGEAHDLNSTASLSNKGGRLLLGQTSSCRIVAQQFGVGESALARLKPTSSQFVRKLKPLCRDLGHMSMAEDAVTKMLSQGAII